ncbi:P-loop containing nucleoside triphosphate hydrolase protein [Panaeolus papilionaceus]|nr:P-loop containing nucleoside triphosphate hydrolase protein [Panaeolus papilionaceus]
MKPITALSHAQKILRSQKNLQNAGKDAKKGGIDIEKLLKKVEHEFTSRQGSQPYDWQMKVTEAMLVKLDSIVIAGTGSGKTMPFMMVLLADPEKKALIISPLKILQEDQVARFKKFNISAVAVNGDTWCDKLAKVAFRSYLINPTLSESVAMVVVDEAHCVSQWGNNFRTEYSEVGKLRSFFPVDTPFLITSATLPPNTLIDLEDKFNLDLRTCFYINLGNDRPNIKMSVKYIKSNKDYTAVLPLLTPNGCLPSSSDDIIKTIIFVDSVSSTQLCAKKIQCLFPPHLHSHVDVLNALRSRRSKRRVMREFGSGKVKVLVATEAAGMGADIPDIERVIQLGAPQSLSIWVQRAGRAGRSSDIKASAIMLAEESVFKAKGSKKKSPEASLQSPVADDEDMDEPMDEGSEYEDNVDVLRNEGEELGWVKTVDPDLRRWLEARGCRRDILDEFFGNPPERKGISSILCFKAAATSLPSSTHPLSVLSSPAQRPKTPESTPPLYSPHSSPSKSVNGNGKRPMGNREPPKRQKAHLKAAKDALLEWRYQTKLSKYTPSSLTAAAILPDTILTKLATHTSISTLKELNTIASRDWILGPRHFVNVRAILARIDQARLDEMEAARLMKQGEIERRREEKRLRQDEERRYRQEAKQARQQQAVVRAEQMRLAQAEKRANGLRAQIKTGHAALRPDEARSSMDVFSLTPTTPITSFGTAIFSSTPVTPSFSGLTNTQDTPMTIQVRFF